MLGSDLAWIVWPQISMAEAGFWAPHQDRTISWFHTTCVIVTFFTWKARERCTNTLATGAAVISGARKTIVTGKGIVIRPSRLVSLITFLGRKSYNQILKDLWYERCTWLNFYKARTDYLSLKAKPRFIYSRASAHAKRSPIAEENSPRSIY